MSPIVDELQDEGHEVVFEETVDGALALLKDSTQSFDLAVLDMLMPLGQSLEGGPTRPATQTGLQLYDELRRLRPTLKVVVFTAVGGQQLAEHFAAEDRTLCKFIHKTAALPYQFVAEIAKFLE